MRLDGLLDRLAEAPCIGKPVSVFFPDHRGGRRSKVEEYAEAAGVCASCPVVDACWQYLGTFERRAARPLHGYAAGLRPEERDRLYREAAA